MFCWETLGPGIYVNAKLTHTTHPNTAADQVQSHMVLPASPQKLPRKISKDVIMSWRRRPGLPIPQIHVQSMGAPLCNPQDSKGSAARSHRTAPEVLCPCLNRIWWIWSTGPTMSFWERLATWSHLGNIPELLSRAYIEDPHHNEWRWAASLDLPARRQANSF